MNETTLKQNYNPLHRCLDNCGVFLSLACGIHCLAMPLLIIALPLIGLEFLLNETAEKVLAIITILLAGTSLFWGWRRHGKSKVFILFLSGALLIFTTTFAMNHGHQCGSTGVCRPQENPLGLLFLVTGALMLSGGHLMNRHYCKKCLSFQGDPAKNDCKC